ncbi:TPA: helix-turn-helix domain-containing protein, partial [Burkholderia cenocepacia]
MSHGSARLTVHGRRLIVQRHQAGWPQAHIAAAMGVSRKCVKTWIDRFAAEGDAGLVTRSSRPHSMPAKTSDEVEQKVLAARAKHREGPDVLGPKIGVPPRTVSRILRRHS